MKAGNATYLSADDITDVVPVFPLAGALLLPGGQIPLNIFEPRYLAMVDDAMRSDKLIAMIQPALKKSVAQADARALCTIGCLGRITALQESGDGRYVISLSGICRFRIREETKTRKSYRKCRIVVFAEDFILEDRGDTIDREALLAVFREFLEANDMEADWESVTKTDTQTLVTSLCMMSPYGPAEKQALLEAPDLKSRAEALIAMTRIQLAEQSDTPGSRLQ